MLEAFNPKLSRRVRLFDRAIFNLWISLEADTAALGFCERPAQLGTDAKSGIIERSARPSFARSSAVAPRGPGAARQWRLCFHRKTSHASSDDFALQARRPAPRLSLRPVRLVVKRGLTFFPSLLWQLCFPLRLSRPMIQKSRVHRRDSTVADMPAPLEFLKI